MVERNLAKVEVTSSSLVTRSKFTGDSSNRVSRFLLCGPPIMRPAARVAKSVYAADLKFQASGARKLAFTRENRCRMPFYAV